MIGADHSGGHNPLEMIGVKDKVWHRPFLGFTAYRMSMSENVWFENAACVNSFIKAEHVLDGIHDGRFAVLVAV